MIQAIVVVNGVEHVHSQAFASKEEAIRELKKNASYSAIVGWLGQDPIIEFIDLKEERK